MATAELENPPVVFTIQPITYEVTKAEIEKVVSGAMMLRVADHNDKANLDRCHKTRMQLRDMRLTVEKKRKALKADSLEYGRRVDSTAKELIGPIEKAEAHLQEQEDVVKREQERIAREAEEKRQAKMRERKAALDSVECPITTSSEAAEVEALSDADFAALVETARGEMLARKAERERIAAEQKDEAERLAKEKAELDRQRREQEAAQAKIDAEKKRLADEEAERQRQAELEKAKAEAAERAKREAEEKAQREAAEAKAKAEAEERERQRRESLRPDHEKLLAVADAIEAIVVPNVSDVAGKIRAEVCKVLLRAATDVRGLATDLINDKPRAVGA